MANTIFRRALDFVADGMTLGLGSGRAANKFTELLGERVRAGLRVRGVPTSQATAELAARVGVPLVGLADAPRLDLTVDGADEVDPQLNLIKGYGRALVREKIVAAASRNLVILVGAEKLVAKLGARGRLRIEVVPFAAPVVLDSIGKLGIGGEVHRVDDHPFVSDNGNWIIDLAIDGSRGIGDARALEANLRGMPGVVGTGLFLGSASAVLVGDEQSFDLLQEMRRPGCALTESLD